LSALDIAEALIKRHEGLKLEVYADTVGERTCGWGHNLGDTYCQSPITQATADAFFESDFKVAQYTCVRLFGDKWNSFSDNRQAALLDMSFQLGYPRLSKFVHMIAACLADNWNSAADNALGSLWAEQVHDRAQEDSDLLRNG
jgi:lysozyme